MIAADQLRPPAGLDLLADAYKDWLHLNVFVPAAGMVGLVNVSLHGEPNEPSSLAVGTAMMCDLEGGWKPYVAVVGQHEAAVTKSAVTAGGVTVGVDPATDAIFASVAAPEIELQLSCRPAGPAIVINDASPFGSGWIAWRAVPRLVPTGMLRVGGAEIGLRGATTYHDHNWGRWYWGDDAGWEWGTFHGDDAVTFTVARTTRRNHRSGVPAAWMSKESATHLWAGESVRVDLGEMRAEPIVRVPGAMAALNSGRAQPQLPRTVVVEADDGYDRMKLELEVAHACQIIAAEPTRSGWGFIHELVGRFRATTVVGDVVRHHEGLGVFEYVD